MKIQRVALLVCLLMLAAPPAAAGPFEDGQAAHQRGQYLEAIMHFTTDINSGSNTTHNLAVVYNNRGNTYMSLRQWDKALADFNRAIELDPSHANTYYNRALVWDKKGDKQKAEADAKKYAALAPEDPDGPKLLARLADPATQPPATQPPATQPPATQPSATQPPARSDDDRGYKPASFYNDRGWDLYKAGKLQQALADFNKAIELDPSFALAYNNRGIVHRKLGLYDKALADYSRAIRLYPTSRAAAFSYFNRALLHERNGKYDLAIADAKTFIKMAPSDKDGPKLLARLEKKAGGGSSVTPTTTGPVNQPPATMPPTTQSKATPPVTMPSKDQPPLSGLTAKDYTRKGWALYKQGMLQEAVAQYDLAIKADPDFALAYHNRGLAYRQLKRYNEAISDYCMVMKLKPDVAVAYYNRSMAYELKGDLESALADIQKYMEMEPKDPDGPKRLAIIKKKMAEKK